MQDEYFREPIIDLNLGRKILNREIEIAQAMICDLVDTIPFYLEKIKLAYLYYLEDDYDPLPLEEAAYYQEGVQFCGTPRLHQSVAKLIHDLKLNTDLKVIKSDYEDICYQMELILNEYDKMK